MKFNVNRSALRERIVNHFSREELRVLVFDLAIPPLDVEGQTLNELVVSFLELIELKGMYSELLRVLETHRPRIEWSQLIKSTKTESNFNYDRIRLRKMLMEALALSDIEILCFDLNIDTEGFGSRKSEIIIGILLHLERNENIHLLVNYLESEHNYVNWEFVSNNSVLPEHVEASSPKNMAKYILETGKDSIPLLEAKLLLIGQGGVGKTSVVNRLLDQSFNDFEEKTEGISIDSWPIKISNDVEVRLNVWDFGGQEIYHATHQFFFSKRSLYLLVIDARQGENESRLEYWLKLVETFGGDSPVIIVVNKIDEHYIELDERGLLIKYPNIRGIAYISCKDGTGITDLNDSIIKSISGLNHIFDELRSSWYFVKNSLEDMEKDFISYDSYIDLCKEQEITDEADQRILIGILHDLGVVLNYHDDVRLVDTNVLNPEWVTQGVYQVITSEILSKNQGFVDLRQLGQILDIEKYPPRKHPFIIDMMTKFELCLPIDGKKDSFLVPDLLPVKEPDLGWDYKDNLRFEYEYDVLPGSVFSRFIVRMQNFIFGKTYWRNGVVTELEGCIAIIKSDREEKRVSISITEIDPLNKNTTNRRSLLSIIRAHFKEIHESLAKLEVREVVPLPNFPKHVITYKELRSLEKYNIDRHFYPKIENFIDVQALLNGIELPQERNLPELRDKLLKSFSKKEIIDLCFKLNIDHQNLEGETKVELARELLLLLNRGGRIPELLNAGKQINSRVDW